MKVTIIAAEGCDPCTTRVNGWEAETHIAAGDSLAYEAKLLQEWTYDARELDGGAMVLVEEDGERFEFWPREELLALAEECLDAKWTGEHLDYYAEETSTWYRCDNEGEIVDLGRMLAAGTPDAYSHWCAGTSHESLDAE